MITALLFLLPFLIILGVLFGYLGLLFHTHRLKKKVLKERGIKQFNDTHDEALKELNLYNEKN